MLLSNLAMIQFYMSNSILFTIRFLVYCHIKLYPKASLLLIRMAVYTILD